MTQAQSPLAPAGPPRDARGMEGCMMSSQTRWTIFIVGNAAIAAVVWLTAPLAFGERPPLWVWAVVAAVIVTIDAALAVRLRRTVD